MNHLTTEELLLLADGELLGDAPTHFESCSECQAALGTLQGRLTTISSALHGSVAPEPIENNARSWARLEAELAACSGGTDQHLTREELLLHLDGAAPIEHDEHLAACRQCELAYMDLRALLSDVEHELRSLMPDEPLEFRLAAHEALRNQMRPAAPVVEFPMRWSAVYAAAAAAVVFMFAGAWMSRQPAEQPMATAEVTAPASASVVAAPPSATSASLPSETSGLEGRTTAAPETAVGEPQPAFADEIVVAEQARPEEYVALSFPTPAPPNAASALAVETPAPSVAVAVRPFAVEFGLPAVIAPMPVGRTAAPVVSRQDALRVLDGRRLLARAGVWREDVRPVVKDGILALTGSVENAAAFERLKGAVMRASGGNAPLFDISLRSNSGAPTEARRAVRVADSPVGGLVRTALVEHYRDAARRSFRAASPAALDGEIARYVDGVFRSQDQLIEHAYALDQIAADAAAVSDDAGAKKIVGRLADFHLTEAEQLEARIYDQLSEALPRRYWNYRPRDDAGVPFEGSQAEQSDLLLADVLALEEHLTTLFTGSSAVLNVESGERSSGELLHRIHSRLRHLKTLTR